MTIDALMSQLHADHQGLTAVDAATRLRTVGPNADAVSSNRSPIYAVIKRLSQPLSLILLAAGVVSVATGDGIGGSIIVAILALSVGLDTFQEGHAIRAADVLRKSVALKATVKRDGAFKDITVDEVVPGDIVRVSAGDIIPADALILESTSFTANEAALTGEAYAVEKRAGTVTSTATADAANAIFRGAVAQTGEALALVVGTGRATLFGSAASALGAPTEISPFQRDLTAYGLLTAKLTIVLVIVVLATSLFFGRPPLQSLLFAVALAVGLTPELLPMITTVTLSRGAIRMARRKVIVKRLASIHDLGAMTVLCTDKTGTLTAAEISLARSIGPIGVDDPRPSRLGAIAAGLCGGSASLDLALVKAMPQAPLNWTLLSQRGFDFARRIGSALVTGPDGTLLIVKGAPEEILKLCGQSRADHDTVMAQVGMLGAQGLRTIAIATRSWTGTACALEIKDEVDLTFEGLCAFADPPKASAAAAVARLHEAGIRLVVLSGDDPAVVERLAGLVGLKAKKALSGVQVGALSDAALAVRVRTVGAYGRLAPDQKARLIRALQAGGEIVGYLGDGINDAPALKAADVGLSVDGAAGVAQASADMIMLDSDLSVVADGVEEGRRTFANILKYIRMEAGSNFGNMLSMALASLFLPFLPMLPTQILLNNLLYDISQIGVPFDSVRPEAVARPQKWDMHALVRFVTVMGSLSSIFDLLTFGGLVLLFHVSPPEFRTAWFLESMATQILVIFAIRTNGRPWRNLPRPILAATSLGALAVAMILPFTPIAGWFGFEPPPLVVTFCGGQVVLVYLVCAELLKQTAIKRTGQHARPGHRARSARTA
ncbi:MAG: magnesium-translocating P-type ATPase [Sphingomonas sp.]